MVRILPRKNLTLVLGGRKCHRGRSEPTLRSQIYPASGDRLSRRCAEHEGEERLLLKPQSLGCLSCSTALAAD
jgi:hypothetical protein